MNKLLTATKVASRREWLDDEIEHLEIERDLLRSKEDIAAGRLVPNEAVMKMLEAKCR
ncbi:MAG: hypothetical protein LBC64_05440 [Fibromonadaceae bacterium]|jgi:predicted dithiol-disulfide oxidoreductase (DUF899 family)|nr:hypothetical protein [Fibromonadaceae bacterium]